MGRPVVMEDHARGIVELKWMDGEVPHSLFLRFDQRALRYLKSSLKLESIGQVFNALQDLDPENLQKAVHCGLVWHRPDVKFEELDGATYTLIDAASAVTKALSLAMWGSIGGPSDEDIEGAEEASDTEGPPSGTSSESLSEQVSASSDSTH